MIIGVVLLAVLTVILLVCCSLATMERHRLPRPRRRRRARVPRPAVQLHRAPAERDAGRNAIGQPAGPAGTGRRLRRGDDRREPDGARGSRAWQRAPGICSRTGRCPSSPVDPRTRTASAGPRLGPRPATDTGCAGEPETDPYNCPIWFGWVAAASESGEPWLTEQDIACPEEPYSGGSRPRADGSQRLSCSARIRSRSRLVSGDPR